jgi:dienelactone hydrolase
MRVWLGLLIAAAISGQASASEQIHFPGDKIELKALLFKPAGEGPFPAVVGLHGCSGLTNRAGAVDDRFRDWGERFSAAGYVVMFPDSFGSRGTGSQCRVREGRIRSMNRVGDANAARRWLQSQSWVKPDRVFLVGWSHGAATVLYTVRPRPRARVRDAGPDFRSAVAFYPGCRRSSETAWSARVPTLILIGLADDWTPAAACQTMVDGARGRSALADIVTYPNAHHAFDHPNMPLRETTGLAVTADGSGRAHLGTNVAAREDAIRRVTEWLAR